MFYRSLIARLKSEIRTRFPPPAIQEPWEGVPDAFRRLPYGTLSIPETLAEWEAQRSSVRDAILHSLGELPPRPKPEVRIVKTDQRDGYRVEKFVFHNGVDFDVPGYLAIPDGPSGPRPAILALHGHGSHKENLFGYEPTSQDVAGLLAREGYVVAGIDSYFHGERRGKGPAGALEANETRAAQETSLFKLNLWLGRTLWGMMLREDLMTLDYLVTRPEVDPHRIGAQGMSMGSTRAWWLAALDERVKAIVCVACFTRYQDLIATRALAAHGIYYFVPGLLRHFDAEGVMALAAPRPFLALTGDRDIGSPPQGMRTLESILQHFYRLYNQPENFRSVIYPATGHVYTPVMKQEMVSWFRCKLK